MKKIATSQMDSRKENWNRPIGKAVNVHQWFYAAGQESVPCYDSTATMTATQESDKVGS